MATSLRLALVGWLALTLGALLVVLGPRLAPADAAPVAPAAQTSSSHPYSDPTWFPLRTPVQVGCAKSGCGTPADHGFEAIDLVGHQGDPVYAAGAGIAHVGGNVGGCSGSGEVEGGRWVWIDHGAGVVSRYHHLDTVGVVEGQLVTPATQIGSMGHSGDVAPCSVNYLHFEVRHDGVRGERVGFGSLRGCGSTGAVQLPQVLGFDSWNDPGLHPAKRLTTPRLGSGCITPDWTTTAASPAPVVSRTDRALRVSVDLPVHAGRWAVEVQIWRPSLNAWDTLSTVAVPAATSSTAFTDGVENSRRYRVRAAVHQGQGWSAWSGIREALGKPAAPAPRYLEWKKPKSTKKSYLHYGWNRPDSLGSPVTGYTVARRCASKPTRLTSWKTASASAGSAYKNLRSLKKAKVCEVRVQAKNALGTGPWSTPQRITR